MQFIDEVKLTIKAGDGGNGAIAFRRERYRPKGGPSGGDGGKGGHIIFKADTNLNTLLDLHGKVRIEAKQGENGRGKDCHGKSSKPLVVRVPVGTMVFDDVTGRLMGDLTKNDEELLAAKGGKGGLGNMHFATSSNQAPQKASAGQIGEERSVRLELKLLADAGLVGLPSVGKSSLISRLSAARPKIAQYPFTTLVPNLGVVRMGDESSFVMADIPGIIKGASQGAGLGIQFLKHIQRTAVLLYVVACESGRQCDPYDDFLTLKKELGRFDEDLAKRPFLIVLNKIDLPETQKARDLLSETSTKNGIELAVCSAITGQGLEDLKSAVWRLIKEGKISAETSDSSME